MEVSAGTLQEQRAALLSAVIEGRENVYDAEDHSRQSLADALAAVSEALENLERTPKIDDVRTLFADMYRRCIEDARRRITDGEHVRKAGIRENVNGELLTSVAHQVTLYEDILKSVKRSLLERDSRNPNMQRSIHDPDAYDALTMKKMNEKALLSRDELVRKRLSDAKALLHAAGGSRSNEPAAQTRRSLLRLAIVDFDTVMDSLAAFIAEQAERHAEIDVMLRDIRLESNITSIRGMLRIQRHQEHIETFLRKTRRGFRHFDARQYGQVMDAGARIMELDAMETDVLVAAEESSLAAEAAAAHRAAIILRHPVRSAVYGLRKGYARLRGASGKNGAENVG